MVVFVLFCHSVCATVSKYLSTCLARHTLDAAGLMAKRRVAKRQYTLFQERTAFFLY